MPRMGTGPLGRSELASYYTRVSDDLITEFGSVGLVFQDLVAGWLAYGLAVERQMGRNLICYFEGGSPSHNH